MARDASIATGAFRFSSSGLDMMAQIMHTVIDTSVCCVLTLSWKGACGRSAAETCTSAPSQPEGVAVQVERLRRLAYGSAAAASSAPWRAGPASVWPSTAC